MKIVGITCVRNEAKRYLKKVLEEKSKLCDVIVVLGDAPTDNTSEVCREFDNVIYYHNPDRLFNTAQWKLKEMALELAVKEYPDWILAFDADELFEKRVNRKALERLARKGENSYMFRFVHLWDNEKQIRIDGYWDKLSKIIFYKYRHNFPFYFPKKQLHCGLVPIYAHHNPAMSGYLVKHYGYMKKKDRLPKVKRYSTYDPDGRIKPKSWYESIQQQPKVVKFNEKEFIKSLLFQTSLNKRDVRIEDCIKKMSNSQKMVTCISPKNGKRVSIPYTHYMDHARHVGYKPVGKVPEEEELKKRGKKQMFKDDLNIAKKVKKTGKTEGIPSKADDFEPEKPKEKSQELKELSTGDNICDICGKVCKNPFGLKSHMRTHSDVKPTSKKKEGK